MSKSEKSEQLSTTVKPQFFSHLRRHAYLMRLNNNEVLELYQSAYLRELEAEKESKRLNHKLKEKGSVICPRCGSEVEKFLTASPEKK